MRKSNSLYDKDRKAHFDAQRKRLKHFLKVASEVRAVKDVMKIKELIRELTESKRPLPYLRINELRYLDVMTSPYN